MNPQDPETFRQAAGFFLALMFLCICFGCWLWHILTGWRIKRLQERIERQNLELSMNSNGRRVIRL